MTKAQRKEKVIEAFHKSFCNVYIACQNANVGRTTFYQWKKDDKDFAQTLEDTEEMNLDIAESKLFEQVKQGNTTAIIFFLKTKAQHRGYIETQQYRVSKQIMTEEQALAELEIARSARLNGEYDPKIISISSSE